LKGKASPSCPSGKLVRYIVKSFLTYSIREAMEVSFYSRSRLLFLSSSVCRKWSSTIVGNNREGSGKRLEGRPCDGGKDQGLVILVRIVMFHI